MTVTPITPDPETTHQENALAEIRSLLQQMREQEIPAATE